MYVHIIINQHCMREKPERVASMVCYASNRSKIYSIYNAATICIFYIHIVAAQTNIEIFNANVVNEVVSD